MNIHNRVPVRINIVNKYEDIKWHLAQRNSVSVLVIITLSITYRFRSLTHCQQGFSSPESLA